VQQLIGAYGSESWPRPHCTCTSQTNVWNGCASRYAEAADTLKQYLQIVPGDSEDVDKIQRLLRSLE
jgi:hypothetical protein